MRCGTWKKRALGPCRACGHVPEGEERAVAWLLSDRHLADSELEQSAVRIRGGEVPLPSAEQRRQARAQLSSVAERDAADHRLMREGAVALAAANLMFSPLVGLALWWGTRTSQPRLARETLQLTAGCALALAAIWAVALGTAVLQGPGAGG